MSCVSTWSPVRVALVITIEFVSWIILLLLYHNTFLEMDGEASIRINTSLSAAYTCTTAQLDIARRSWVMYLRMTSGGGGNGKIKLSNYIVGHYTRLPWPKNGKGSLQRRDVQSDTIHLFITLGYHLIIIFLVVHFILKVSSHTLPPLCPSLPVPGGGKLQSPPATNTPPSSC